MMFNVLNNLLIIHALKMIFNVGKLKISLKDANGMIGIVWFNQIFFKSSVMVKKAYNV